jgi:hypothetical protein
MLPARRRLNVSRYLDTMNSVFLRVADGHQPAPLRDSAQLQSQRL